MGAVSLLISYLLGLCRSRAAAPRGPGDCSRSAICFDYAAEGGLSDKGAPPGKGELSGKGQFPGKGRHR